MLGDGEGSECSVECAPGVCEKGLLHQKLQIHFPDSRHLVQKNQGAFKEGVDFAELGRKYRGIQFLDMLGSEVEILFLN